METHEEWMLHRVGQPLFSVSTAPVSGLDMHPVVDDHWVGYGRDGGFFQSKSIPADWMVVEIPIARSRESGGDISAVVPGQVMWMFRGAVNALGLEYTHKIVAFADPHLAFAFKLRWS
ncbi:MAG: hypothetical protein EOP83_02110 [Verrucomicrobiaceae bacterium]|nr:MAG: hypothetical protein EOP83_02110 [Verrucomicrobiaceae bacterium]